MRLILISLFVAFSTASQAQKTTQAKASAFPKITTTLGNTLSNTLSKGKMQQLLDSTLQARDQHNRHYKVIAFDLGYEQHSTFIDDKTGQTKQAQDYISFSFRADKPDSLWRKRIKAEIQPGDELFFDRVLVQNPKGEKYESSSLHFVISK